MQSSERRFRTLPVKSLRNAIARRATRVKTKFSKRKLGRLSRGWLRAARLRLGAQRREYDKADHETEANKAWSKYRREGEQWQPPEARGPKPKKKKKDIMALRKLRKQGQKAKKQAARALRPALSAPTTPSAPWRTSATSSSAASGTTPTGVVRGLRHRRKEVGPDGAAAQSVHYSR